MKELILLAICGFGPFVAFFIGVETGRYFERVAWLRTPLDQVAKASEKYHAQRSKKGN